MLGDAQLHAAAEYLDARFGLVALWLFGSQATGRARSDSDVDLAALFVARPDVLAIVDAAADLEGLLHRSVDLVDLSRASPALARQVLRSGRLILDHNPSARFRFETELPSRYEDLRLLRAPIERAIAERLRG